MNGTATEAAIQQLVNLDKAGDIGSDFLGGSGAVSGETGFPKGEYAMYIDGPWAVPDLPRKHNFARLRHGAVPVRARAAPSRPSAARTSSSPGTSRTCPTPRSWPQFLAAPFAQLQMANQGDLAGYTTDSAAEVKAQPYLSIFVQQLHTAKARPVAPGYPELDADFSAELQEVLAGKLSVSDAMNTAAQEANAALGCRQLVDQLDHDTPSSGARRQSRRAPPRGAPAVRNGPAGWRRPTSCCCRRSPCTPSSPSTRSSASSRSAFSTGTSSRAPRTPSSGWSNYTKIFHDPIVRTAALNSFLYIVVTVPVQMALGPVRRRRADRPAARLGCSGGRPSTSRSSPLGRRQLGLRLHLQLPGRHRQRRRWASSPATP